MRKGDYDLKVIDFGLSFNWKENMNLELKERR